MGRRPQRLVLIGLDGVSPKRIEYFVKKGHLPNFKSLLERGTLFPYCLPAFPTITPPNWATIATGATPGTHGVTCFHVYDPGHPLNRWVQAFSSKRVHAEFLWESALRADKRSIILTYPCAWPPRVPGNLTIGGSDVHAASWRDGLENWEYRFGISDGLAFTATTSGKVEETVAEKIGDADFAPPEAFWTIGKLEGPRDWANLPPGKFRVSQWKITPRYSRYGAKPKVIWVLLDLRNEPSVRLCFSKDFNDCLVTLERGRWSRVLCTDFQTERGPVKGYFRIKLYDVRHEGRWLHLLTSPIISREGWVDPPDFFDRLPFEHSMPNTHGTYAWVNKGIMDMETFVEMEDAENSWHAGVFETFFPSGEWDLFFSHTHCMDSINHHVFSQLGKNPQMRSTLELLELAGYKSLDNMIGRMLSAAGDECMIVIVSDHGAVTYTDGAFAWRLLVELGYTVEKTPPKPGDWYGNIDWSRTRAIGQRSSYIYINLKGRDPNGIVEPKDYESLRDQIIDDLYSYKCPKTGQRLVSLALKSEDARLIGLGGTYEEIGDIFFSVADNTCGMGGVHGAQLPTEERGDYSMHALLLISGPGIKKGQRLERTAHLEDVVPTICYVMGLPVPAQTEGAVLYQAIESL